MSYNPRINIILRGNGSMEPNRKLKQNASSNSNNVIHVAEKPLPEWHPFAVWKDQIKSQQTEKSGKRRVLHSVSG